MHPDPRGWPARPWLVTILLVLGALPVLITGCRATPTPTVTPRLEMTPSAEPTATPSPTPAPTSTPAPTATPTITPTPNPYARGADEDPLTGLKVSDPASLTRRPLFVAINNDPVARPYQSGFTQTDLVYEYIMEGRGVTRFTLVFLGSESDRIRPLRSARLVNFYLTPQYGGAMVASGANGQINWFLKFKMGVPYLNVDVDDPCNCTYVTNLDSGYQTRVQSSTGQLRQWLADIKGDQDPKLRGFPFTDQPPAGASGLRAEIAYPQAVIWNYDAASERYLREMKGTPHLDAANGQPISAANVIIQTVKQEPTEYIEDSNGTTSIRLITVGEGPVALLRNGVAITGTWQAGETSMPEFRDQAGKLITLKRGNSWFELVAADDAVTVK